MIILSPAFLFLAVFLVYSVFISAYFKGDFRKSGFNRAFFSGMFLFIFAQLIYQLINLFYKVNYEWFSLYLYLWVTEILPYITVLTAGYFLLVRKGFFRQESYQEYPGVFSFTTGVLVLSGLFRAVNSLMKFDSYILFLYPLLTISILILFPVIVVEAGVRRGYAKVFVFTVLLPFSLILVFIPWLYYINYFFVSLGVTVLISAGSFLIFLLFKKDYIRK